MRIALLIIAFAAGPAAACVTPQDLVAGISFARKDGHSGTIRQAGGDLLIDYAAEDGVRVDTRRTRLGIYELQSDLLPIDEIEPGTNVTGTARKFRGDLAMPVAGGTTELSIRETRTDYAPGPDGSQKTRLRLNVTYRFLETAVTEIGGCRYTVLPVEAEFSGDYHQKQRWIYFPDLGFGLETGRDGSKNGLTRLIP